MNIIYIDKEYYRQKGCDLDIIYGFKKEKDYPLVTQSELMDNIIKSPKIVKRALYAKWIAPLIQGGKGKQSLFTPSSIDSLIYKLKTEQPPLLPCEMRVNSID
jgi:hypothetical protein